MNTIFCLLKLNYYTSNKDYKEFSIMDKLYHNFMVCFLSNCEGYSNNDILFLKKLILSFRNDAFN